MLKIIWLVRDVLVWLVKTKEIVMEQIKLFNMESFEFQDSYILASHMQNVARQLVASKDGAITKSSESTLSSKKRKAFILHLKVFKRNTKQ
jgi:hypothetical protein